VRDPAGGSGGAGAAEGDGWVPIRLRDRFGHIEELSSGGEADVYLVETGAKRRVLKVYRRGIELDLQVRLKLKGVNAPGLATIYDWGIEDGRHFELVEYVHGQTLAELLRDHPAGLPADLVKAMAGQLADALDLLHNLDIARMDIKPANIMVRAHDPRRPSDDPSFVLIDFGTASHSPRTMMIHSTVARTIAYAAPEIFTKHAGAPSDWWSLGITALELAAGRHPFHGMSDEAVTYNIVTKLVPIPDVIDPRINYLCHGLIVANPDARWRAEQVRRWAKGEEPPLPADRAPKGARRGHLPFNGQSYTERAPFARALAENWRLAADHFFNPMAEPWHQVRTWSRQFGDPNQSGASAMADRLDRSGLPPDVNLLLLLRWLDPSLPPLYRDRQLAVSDISTLAKEAAHEGATIAQEIIDDLWEHQVLTILAEAPAAPGAAGLTGIDRKWRRLAARWQTVTARLRRSHQEVGPSLDLWPDSRVRAYLLWLAADPMNASTLLRQVTGDRDEIRRLLQPTRDRLDWYEEIVAAARDPASLLAAFAVSGQARAEAHREWRTGQSARRRREEWNRLERWRDLDRPVALGWAGASMGIVLVGWVMLLLLSDAVDIAGAPDVGRAWTFMVITLTLQTGIELWLAAVIGAPYHPYYSLLIGIARGARVTGERFQPRAVQGLLVVLGTFAVLIAATLYAPFLLPTLLLPAHLAWVTIRYLRWRSDYRRRQRAALSPATFPATSPATSPATGGPR
jgi:serine/threonine protein kinase